MKSVIFDWKLIQHNNNNKGKQIVTLLFLLERVKFRQNDDEINEI